MAIDVQKKLASRRNKSQEISSLVDHHTKERNVLEDIDMMALWMASAVLVMLGETFDDVSPSNIDLRSGFHRSFRRMLTSLGTRQEKVVFLHESIPGFTALAVKKQGWDDLLAGRGPTPAPEQVVNSKKPTKKSGKNSGIANLDSERGQAIESIIDAYVQRTGNRVLNIDASDVTVVLFPVADLKHNLREMGFLG